MSDAGERPIVRPALRWLLLATGVLLVPLLALVVAPRNFPEGHPRAYESTSPPLAVTVSTACAVLLACIAAEYLRRVDLDPDYGSASGAASSVRRSAAIAGSSQLRCHGP